MTVTDHAGSPSTRYSAVTRDVHRALRWRTNVNCLHAAQEAFVPIVRDEFPQAGLAMPIAFTEAQGGYMPVAVMSLAPGTNAFVGPQGNWLARYTPLLIRTFPFRLLKVEGREDFALAVDNAAVTRPDVDPSAQPFYDEGDKLTPEVQRHVDVLLEFERSRKITDLAMAALVAEDVIRPMTITRKTEGGIDQRVTGLFRVDEAALTALKPEAFLRLRDALALPLAYAHLFSLGQVRIFEDLARLKERLRHAAEGSATISPSQPPASSPAFGMVDDQTLRFD